MKFYGNDVVTPISRRLRPGFIDDPLFPGFLEALPEGAAMLDLDGTIRLVNSKLELILNQAKSDLVGTDLTKHTRTVGPIIQRLSAALRQLKRVEVSGSLNSQRAVFATLSVLRTRDGDAYGALLTMREPSKGSRGLESSKRFRFEAENDAAASMAHVQTKAMQVLRKRGAHALGRGSPVLLIGESGTGKTELAKRIASTAELDGLPFVHVNCSMLDAHFEAEMFGIEPGSPADTSTRGKLGFVEAADGGILFLDRVTDLSPASQTKLVAFLETKTYSRVDSAQRRRSDVRLIASANGNLPDLVAAGTFRDDLYYRIAVVSLALPPLRGQSELIAAIVERQLQHLNVGRLPPLRLEEGFRRCLMEYDYPGNIRELTNILEQAAATADDEARVEHFRTSVSTLHARPAAPAPALESRAAAVGLKDLVQEFEAWVLGKAIAEHKSKRSAAKALGIDIATLVRKTKRGE